MITYFKTTLAALLLITLQRTTRAQDDWDALLPVRGFCIAAPRAKELGPFIAFVAKELAPRHVNTLILRVDYNYQYESYPKLRDHDALSKDDVKKLVEVCRVHHIRSEEQT